MSIIRNPESLPDPGDDFAPPDVLRARQIQQEFLADPEEKTQAADEALPSIAQFAAQQMHAVAKPVRETVEQRLERELQSLQPEALGKLFSTVLRKTRQERIEVLISGCRLALQVVGVAVGSNGMSFLVPKDTAFEPDMGLEFVIVHRGRRHQVISTKQLYPFPGLDFNVASFMFVNEDNADDQTRSSTGG